MHVSQLSFTYDWSKFSIDGFQLTSLSADPESTKYSPSRLIAAMADVFNPLGSGSVWYSDEHAQRSAGKLRNIMRLLLGSVIMKNAVQQSRNGPVNGRSESEGTKENKRCIHVSVSRTNTQETSKMGMQFSVSDIML